MTTPKERVMESVIARILEREGGVTQNPGEAYVTRWGQTPMWLTRWRLPAPTSPDEAAMNYRSWIEQTNLDAICTEDDQLPDIVIDFAVHSGERVAIAVMQRAMKTHADGILGPATETALSRSNRGAVMLGVIAGRLVLMGGLITDHPDQFARYARGWAKRLADQIVSLA